MGLTTCIFQNRTWLECHIGKLIGVGRGQEINIVVFCNIDIFNICRCVLSIQTFLKVVIRFFNILKCKVQEIKSQNVQNGIQIGWQQKFNLHAWHPRKYTLSHVEPHVHEEVLTQQDVRRSWLKLHQCHQSPILLSRKSKEPTHGSLPYFCWLLVGFSLTRY